jgi:hypothetical protein
VEASPARLARNYLGLAKVALRRADTSARAALRRFDESTLFDRDLDADGFAARPYPHFSQDAAIAVFLSVASAEAGIFEIAAWFEETLPTYKVPADFTKQKKEAPTLRELWDRVRPGARQALEAYSISVPPTDRPKWRAARDELDLLVDLRNLLTHPRWTKGKPPPELAKLHARHLTLGSWTWDHCVRTNLVARWAIDTTARMFRTLSVELGKGAVSDTAQWPWCHRDYGPARSVPPSIVAERKRRRG